MLAGLEKAMQNGAELQDDRQKGQMNFFGQAGGESDYSKDHQRLPNVPPWPEPMMLAYEKQVLGFYVTSNPLSHCAEKINIYSTLNTSQLADAVQDQPVVIGGMISKVRYHLTRKGRNAGSKMAVLILEDLQGQAEVVMFPAVLSKFADFVVKDKVIFVKGKVDCKREKPNIFAEELINLEDVTEKLAAKVNIRLSAREITKEKVTTIKSICEFHRGKSPLYVSIRTDKGKVLAAADKNLSVNPDVEFCRKMKQLVGPENFQLAR